jgi:hypothetical protein
MWWKRTSTRTEPDREPPEDLDLAAPEAEKVGGGFPPGPPNQGTKLPPGPPN